MTDNRLQQLMQDALDESLSPDEQLELSRELDENPDNAEEFDQQQRVNDMLQRPPMERAPQRLAVTIMARIAEMAQEQQQLAQGEDLDELAQASLIVAIQLVTVATMPLMIGASWMILNAQTDRERLDEIFTRVVALLILVLDVMRVIMEEAEQVAEEDPEAALAILTLMPTTLLELVKQVLAEDDE